MLKNNELEEAVFSRDLSNVECGIVNNRYIAALFYGNRHHIYQIKAFARRYRIGLDRKFDARYSFFKHNKELNGYSADEITTPEVIDAINQNLDQVRKSIVAAIVTSDLAKLRDSIGYAINLNYPNSDGSLPFEQAIEIGDWAIVHLLITKFDCVPNRLKTNGSLVTYACRLGKINIIGGILKMDTGFIEDFLDVDNPSYHYANDALRIIIDMDRPQLLDALFTNLKNNKIFEKQAAQLDKMLSYAKDNGKHAVADYLQSKIAEILNLELAFMQSIISGDMENFSICIARGVNVNKEIEHRYPLEVACLHQQWDIVSFLLKNDDIIFSRLYESEVYEYDVRLDVAKYIIDSDQILPLLMLLQIDIEGQLRSSYLAVNLMLEYAKQNNRIQIKEFLQEKIQKSNERLFKAALLGDCQELNAALANHANINAIIDGKSILHVVCEASHVAALHLLLQQPNIDVNCVDFEGNYPLTLACKQKDYAILEMLLDERIVRKCEFQASDESYDPRLDVLKEIIDADNFAFLEPVLRRASLIHNSRDNMLVLYNYARAQHKTHSAQQLAAFIDRLSTNRTLFDPGQQLRLLGNDSQGISRVDLSFTISLMRLYARYDATIEPVKNQNYSSLGIKDRDVLTILSELKRMVDAAESNQYKIYTLNSNSGSNSGSDEDDFRYATDEEYKKWAMTTYNRLITSVTTINPRAWHSSWLKTETNKIERDVGINIGEVWCLAILAAQDRFAINGMELTDDVIKYREQILVSALVECTRAYHYDGKKYFDSGVDNNTQYSCDHGVAVRALLSLCGMHDEIHIHENPLEWAHEVAKDALHKFFNSSANKDVLNDLLLKYKFQRTRIENIMVSKFYSDAITFVRDELVNNIGTIDKNGYLSEKDLQNILSNLKSIELPLIKTSVYLLEKIVSQANDFSKLHNADFTSKNDQLVSQYKLPLSSDSLFAALIMSAKAKNIELAPNITVHMLRHMVAHIISCAINNVPALQQNLQIIFRGCNVNPLQSSIIIAGIKQLIKNSLILENDPNAVNYLRALRLYAQADNLVLSLISALFGVNITCYDFTGAIVAQYSSSQFFLHPKNNGCIDYSCKIVQDGTKFTQVRSICCAVINNEDWPAIRELLPKLQTTNTAERLAKDNICCKNYNVMLGRNIANFDQIKMPAGDDNLLVSVFVAARCANVPNQYSFMDIKDMIKNNDILQGSNSDASILELLARLYNVRIVVYNLAKDQPQYYGEGTIELRLHQANEHYNLLILPRNWYGFDERLLSEVEQVQDKSAAVGLITNETPMTGAGATEETATESLARSDLEPSSKRRCYTMQ